jgi:hypothetical protein
MKKLMLALTLATLGTASLCAMETVASTPVVDETGATAATSSLDDVAVAAVESNVNAANADATAKAGALSWIKSHKLLIGAMVVTFVGAFCAYKYVTSVKSCLNTCGSFVADKATGAWTVCRDNKQYSIPATAAVVIIAAISADLLRGEKSLIKKMFSKKETVAPAAA